MININETLQITVMIYITQFNSKLSKHYNSNFYTIPVSLEIMYLNKYDTKGYYINHHPFKARCAKW